MFYAKALCQQVNPQVFGTSFGREQHEHKHEHKHKPEHHRAAHDRKPAKPHTHKPAPASHAKRNTSHPDYLDSHTPAPASHWDRNKIYTQDWIPAVGLDGQPPVAEEYSPVNMLKPLGWVALAGLAFGSFVIARRAIENRA